MESPFSILQSAPEHAAPHPHEVFSASAILEQRLRERVKGEVRFDQTTRALYSTDASNYRQVPIGLVIPRDVQDVIATIAACREFGAPVLSRGAGRVLPANAVTSPWCSTFPNICIRSLVSTRQRTGQLCNPASCWTHYALRRRNTI